MHSYATDKKALTFWKTLTTAREVTVSAFFFLKKFRTSIALQPFILLHNSTQTPIKPWTTQRRKCESKWGFDRIRARALVESWIFPGFLSAVPKIVGQMIFISSQSVFRLKTWWHCTNVCVAIHGTHYFAPIFLHLNVVLWVSECCLVFIAALKSFFSFCRLSRVVDLPYHSIYQDVMCQISCVFWEDPKFPKMRKDRKPTFTLNSNLSFLYLKPRFA